MYRAVAIAIVCLHAATAHADDGEPVRVSIECELQGRTKACPAFLRGLVDANPVLRYSPRAGADVVVYATATQVALVDRVHLRFVGQAPNGPAPVELDAELDTRVSDDEQRAALTPAFLRGVALFVAAKYPAAVEVTLKTPKMLGAAQKAGSPWGAALELNANGSYASQYRTVGGQVTLVGRYVTRRFRAFTLQTVQGAINQQPPLVLDDGTQVSLDSDQWKYRFGAEAVYSWTEQWSIGAGSYTFLEDPKGQYHYNTRNRVAVEWDMFPADDPRGNRLGVFYHLGWQVERYNIRNEIGESFAQYPTHGIDAVGSVRRDRLSFGLTLSSDVQLNHPGRRILFIASPFATIQIGNHVDLNLSFSITERRFPVPDPAAIDPSDYAQQSRLVYAEPLSLTGTIGVVFHWDATNGVRNDRIESI